MHIYAFGSICRGDVTKESDIDLLALVQGFDTRFDPDKFSIYSYRRIDELWQYGNPFAWHLSLESNLLHSSDGKDYLRQLGRPNSYLSGFADCSKFRMLVTKARNSLRNDSRSLVFDLSTIFLGIRNFATCFSLAMCETPIFGRDAALKLGDYSIPVDSTCYDVLRRARILSTRGIGEGPTSTSIQFVLDQLGVVDEWMEQLLELVKNDERIQQ